ncbi:Pleckstrin homology domain-containing family G member 7 [Oryzias melastigma]|uniref:Pleckstrin homology domain-containing family G member 7 n=2 Tax=Oryzias melastigma TaxID=30732 RepID=A0A834KWH3_ORYME|nr:pleckstrin homology domain-containing family G member 7 isoform X1 [Oryzias melastigma]KAF6735637.1 Pleckstrin homology domain-containing family G member 7 [Oryzias melastigma]
MSTLNHVILQDKEQDNEKKLGWSYIEWIENEVVMTGVAEAQTQTDSQPLEHKASQTTNPVIMHIDLKRMQSKLRHCSPVDADNLVTPLSQFDRQAPGRISTSPTLRRMRSTRRPLLDLRDSSGAQEKPQIVAPSTNPPNPVLKMKSPTATNPPCDEEVCPDPPLASFHGKHKGLSQRSKTSGSIIVSTKQECHNSHPSPIKESESPDDELQGKEHSHRRLHERRRSSVVVSLPGLDVSPGDLFVSNGAVDIINGSNLSDTKKTKWPFLRRNTTKGKLQIGTVADVEKYLSTAQIEDCGNADLQKLKDFSLAQFLQDQSKELSSDSQVCKRQEAIWELFTSECVYFLDQLMVLKEVFLVTLTNLQLRNCLTDVNAWSLFANVNELCLVSSSFLRNLLHVIKDTLEITESGGPTLLELLSKAFKESICNSLQKYCLNYSSALLYLDSLKPREDFGSYLKWCERKEQCRRLQLRDLLVAPLQRLTRYSLLLRNVAKRCQQEEESRGLQVIAEQVDTSICDLEGKVKWLDNYQKVKRLRDALVWTPVWERDKRAFIPETLKHLLKTVTADNLISHRSLLHEGKLVLTENTKLIDAYLFLFDEFLLITKIKKSKKRSLTSDQNPLRVQQQNLELDQLLKEGSTFTVLDQPISLDRLQLKNIDQLNASTSGLPHSFIIMHHNRYQQCIGAFILQAASESAKREWISKIEGAVTELLKLDSEQPRIQSSSSWLESSQI